MKAYKGFNHELKSCLGNGNKETCYFKPGETKEVSGSKTVREGFHCCENPFECLSYYSFDGKNRFFEVEAAGDIDEDGSERIACTKITLKKELTALEFAAAGMSYMIEHPMRQKWEQSYRTVVVQKDKAIAPSTDSIAIARGQQPVASGPAGSILGLLLEDGDGICAAKLLVVTPEQAGKMITIDAERQVSACEM